MAGLGALFGLGGDGTAGKTVTQEETTMGAPRLGRKRLGRQDGATVSRWSVARWQEEPCSSWWRKGQFAAHGEAHVGAGSQC